MMNKNTELFAQNNFEQYRIINNNNGNTESTNNYTPLFIKYVQLKQQDSASMLLQYWQNKTEMDEQLMLAKVIYAGAFNNYDSNIIDDHFLNYYYEIHHDYNLKTKDSNKYQNLLYKDLLEFAQQNMDTYEHKYPEGSDEKILCMSMEATNQRFCENISSPKYKKKKLGQLFLQKLNELEKAPDIEGELFTGKWIPLANTSVLGIHTIIGGKFGLKSRTYSLLFSCEYRVLQKHSEYQYNLGSSTVSSNYSQSYLIGFSFEKLLKKIGKNEFYFQCGAGKELMYPNNEFVLPNVVQNNDAYALYTYYGNGGFGYNLYINETKYLGFQLLCTLSDYSKEKIVDFKEHAISIRLSYGILSNERIKKLYVIKCKNTE
jgi:hypothetical protein